MNILAMYSKLGANSSIIWEFALGVLTLLFAVGLVLMGVSLIRRLIDQ